jgi:hypothetical protein
MITVLRPLSTSELLDRTFHLYRNHFVMFVGISAIPQLFILPLALGGAAIEMRQNYAWSSFMTVTGDLLFCVAWFVSQPPTVVAVSNLQMQKQIGIGSSYSGARRSLLRVIWIVFLMFVVASVIFGGGGTLMALAIGYVVTALPTTTAVFAVLLLTVPLSYFVLRWMLGWSLAIPATVLEGGWFLTSMRRSLHLSRGNRLRIFVVYFLLGVFAVVVSFIVELMLMLSIAFMHIRNPHTLDALTQATQAVAMFVTLSMVGALATIALSLVYYDQRVRKEGFDLQLMMTALQPGTPAVVTEANS